MLALVVNTETKAIVKHCASVSLIVSYNAWMKFLNTLINGPIATLEFMASHTSKAGRESSNFFEREGGHLL